MKIPATLFILISFAAHAQIEHVQPAAVDIVRDRWGVPHIFAKTDAGVSYGLAWAHAEDDFKTIQLGFLAGKAMLGQYAGKSGATVDYVIQFMRCRELVESRYEQDISPQFKSVLQGYCDGINSYAQLHPKEVLIRKVFPISPKDMLTYSVLQLAIAAGADEALKKIISGKMAAVDAWKPGGSNAYAFNSSITEDGSTYLAINSHQPLEGPVAWYEAHLCSEEGWNILGALFPGAPIILAGCNEYLGWAHTVNYPDKLDVYQLEMNPENKYQYKVDGQWQELERTSARMKVKIAGINISVKKEVLRSIYGPTMRVDRGVFAIRTGALMDIRALQQWYEMNRAKNFTEFKAALKMNAISGYNIVYADRYDTIYYVSNGKIPLRQKGFNWRTTLPGNTLQTLWTGFHPFSELPQVLQPASGYLFNSNHSPFNATAAQDNIKANQFDPTMGYETHDNNRSERFMTLIKTYPKLGYADMKKIKYDLQLPLQLKYQTSCDTLFLLNKNNHPDVASLIETLREWDRKADVDSKGAALFSIIYYKVVQEQDAGETYRMLTAAKCLELLNYSKHYLEKHFGTTEVSLGQYQRLVRGEKSIALPGIPDVIASMRSVDFTKGMVKGEQGESYIELVKFTKDGPQIESINSYGASSRPDSQHYADQMELFIQQKTKPMTLNKQQIYETAERIYHPD